MLEETMSPADRRALDEFVRYLRRESVSRIALFGSRARGDCDAESDIDVLVVTSPGRALGGRIRRRAAELNVEHDTMLRPLIVTEEQWAHLGLRERRIVADVAHHGIPL
jgi:predicted nucleotidyltransferase